MLLFLHTLIEIVPIYENRHQHKHVHQALNHVFKLIRAVRVAINTVYCGILNGRSPCPGGDSVVVKGSTNGRVGTFPTSWTVEAILRGRTWPKEASQSHQGIFKKQSPEPWLYSNKVCQFVHIFYPECLTKKKLPHYLYRKNVICV